MTQILTWSCPLCLHVTLAPWEHNMHTKSTMTISCTVYIFMCVCVCVSLVNVILCLDIMYYTVWRCVVLYCLDVFKHFVWKCFTYKCQQHNAQPFNCRFYSHCAPTYSSNKEFTKTLVPSVEGNFLSVENGRIFIQSFALHCEVCSYDCSLLVVAFIENVAHTGWNITVESCKTSVAQPSVFQHSVDSEKMPFASLKMKRFNLSLSSWHSHLL
jgi:hypothetical protein